jgi:hypothetical protein
MILPFSRLKPPTATSCIESHFLCSLCLTDLIIELLFRCTEWKIVEEFALATKLRSVTKERNLLLYGWLLYCGVLTAEVMSHRIQFSRTTNDE